MWPIAAGDFIQLDMTYEWDDNIWDKEFTYLKQVNMMYLVVMGTTLTSGNETKTVYPSQLKGCKMITKQDVLEKMFASAERHAIKVFLGINYNDDWWNKGKDAYWLSKQVTRGNQIAEELYHQYHDRFPNAFYGWYWQYEVDNLRFRSKGHFKGLATAINKQLLFMQCKGIRLPFMLSPYMNSLSSTPARYADNWQYLFGITELAAGDVFAPQDSVGGGGLKLQQTESWFRAFRKAVNTIPGLNLWANVENFEHQDWTSAPLDRFIQQMENVQSHVDNIITFSYSHYYSPINIDPGYHLTYLAYVHTGQMDSEKPSAPATAVICSEDRKKYHMNWTLAGDNIGICGYEVFCNKKQVFKTQVQRKYGATGTYSSGYCSIVKKQSLLQFTKKYKVRAFDFAGNVSEFTAAKTNPNDNI